MSRSTTCIARTRNTGMTYNADRDALETAGDAPVEIEGVTLRLVLRRPGTPGTARVLDLHGRDTGRTLPTAATADGTVITFNGAQERAIYCEITW